MQDPTRQLFGVGRRVIRTVHPLVSPPKFGGVPRAYTDLLLDPMESLSHTCSELVRQTETAMSATEPAVASGEPGDPRASVQRTGTFSPFSWSEGETVRAARRRHAPRVNPREGDPPMQLPDTLSYDPERPSLTARVRHVSDGRPSLFPDDPAMDPGAPYIAPASKEPRPKQGSAEQPVPRRDEGAARAAEWHTPVEEGASGSAVTYGEFSSINGAGESSSAPGGSDPARPSPEAAMVARKAPAKHDRPPAEPGAPYALPASGEPRPEQGTAAAQERDRVRLIADPSRLGTMLREHVVDPRVPSEGPDEGAVRSLSEDGLPAFPSAGQEWPVAERADEEPMRRAPAASAVDERLGVQEIMERLAEEIEAEYVRTYGSSGG